MPSVTEDIGRGSLIASLVASGTGIQVGAALVATRLVVDQADPASLAFLRYSIAVLCLLPFLLISRPWPRMGLRDFLAISGLGVVQFAMVVVVLNYAVTLIPAARAALIFSAFPLVAMLVAAALGQEQLTWRKVAGVLLTIGGVALALGDKAWGDNASGEGFSGNLAAGWLGEIAAFLAACFGAASSVALRGYLRRYEPLHVGGLSMFASVLVLAVLAFAEGYFQHPLRFDAVGWGAVCFIGLSSAIGYFAWLWALRRGSPTQVTIFLGLAPITAAILGVLLLGEAVTLGLLAGIACILPGLALAHWQPVARKAG